MENISDFSSSDSGLQAIRRDINTMTVENPDWEEIQDGYQLRFIGKDYAKLQASLPTETLLVPDVEHNAYSHNQKSENIFITGDNLDTLKHLEKAYTKAIKMIYIDPPYNTGSDGFVYKDNFQFTDDELQQKLSLTEKEVKKIRLLNGKCSHSAWLTFMLPRLILARRLLKDDGVIFISIDDNEQANLKLLCDEIFGEGNFVGDFIRKTKSKTNDAKTGVNYQHEFLLCYAKNSENVNLLGGEKDLSKYTNPDNDPNGLWISSDPSAKRITKNGNFPIINPYTGKTDYPPKGRDWCFSQNTLQDHINAGRICFKKEHKDDERGFIYKRYLKDLATTQKMFDSLAFVDNAYMNQAATTELKELGLVESFPYPKGVEFIKKIIEHIAQKSTQENDIILDFFAGSGTTAHAVMQYNAENRGGGKPLHYIVVQLDEPVKEDSEASKAGYKTIDEIARERIKRASDMLGDTSGFKHYKLAHIDDAYVLDRIDHFDPTQEILLPEDMLAPFSGQALHTNLAASGLETLLCTWLIDDGFPLTTPVEPLTLGTYIAYTPQNSHRIYCLNKGWDSEATKNLLNKIGKNTLKAWEIVVYNHSFSFTALLELKNNLKSLFTHSDKRVRLIERF